MNPSVEDLEKLIEQISPSNTVVLEVRDAYELAPEVKNVEVVFETKNIQGQNTSA